MNSEKKEYYRLLLGRKYAAAPACFENGYIGVDYGFTVDLTNDQSKSWLEFKDKYIEAYMNIKTDSSKHGAAQNLGTISTFKQMAIGSIVICPLDSSSLIIGEVTSDYYYAEGENLPHRRNIKFKDETISKEEFSEGLIKAIENRRTLRQLNEFSSELDSLCTGIKLGENDLNKDETIVFALESHLENFLIANWEKTELGKLYDIYEEDGEITGEQFKTDTGRIDILAISKDKNSLLVIELKRGKTSDAVVGQIQRYMGYVKSEIANPNQEVKGLIIALEEDLKIRRALSVTNNIDFYRYKLDFELVKDSSL
ncbi:MAG: endonuclease NucS [Candidatus Caenarcaniphilales bacterium]|nr:endonuclease NucS [Candidatus Caenarcaniphilales bacterium]